MAYLQFIITLLIIGATYLVWHFGFRVYLFDQFRHKLFTLRDNLFKFASGSELTFESDAYKILREKINLVIRHSDQIRITELVRHLILFKMFPHFFKDYSSSDDIIEHAKKFDKPYSKETRESLNSFEDKLNAEIGLHFLKSYPLVTLILIVFAIPVALLILAKETIQGVRKIDSRKATEVQQYIGKTIYENYEKGSGGVTVIKFSDSQNHYDNQIESVN